MECSVYLPLLAVNVPACGSAPSVASLWEVSVPLAEICHTQMPPLTLSAQRPTRAGSTDPGFPPGGSGSGDAKRTSSLPHGARLTTQLTPPAFLHCPSASAPAPS